MSGARDDGAAGLAAIARFGGRCFVQDPAEALHPWMPRAALQLVPQAQPVAVGKLGDVLNVVHIGALHGRPVWAGELAPAVDGAERRHGWR